MKTGSKRLMRLLLTTVLLLSLFCVGGSAFELEGEADMADTFQDDTGTEDMAEDITEDAATAGAEDIGSDLDIAMTDAATCQHTGTVRWQQSGTEIQCKCMTCKKVIASMELTDTVWKPGAADNPEIAVSKWTIEGYTLADDQWTPYTILFRPEGSEDAGTAEVPTEAGAYEMYLEFTNYKNKVVDCDPVLFQLNAHNWQYSADGYTLCADCIVDGCGAHAEVTIDTTSVYEASRTYTGGELSYEVYYETGWSDYSDIDPYTLLYYGTQTNSRTSTEIYGNCFRKPTTTGNYEVCAAVLADQSEPSSYLAETERKAYYLADIPISSCEVLTYGDTQIAQFTKPSRIETGGRYTYYYVGTLSELLWVLYHGDMSRGWIKIFLTNDIVVNPITVTDSGEVRSASYQIYTWPGFGYGINGTWEGFIEGNGHIIYGLYQDTADQYYCGLVNYLHGVIWDLTVENSMLYGYVVGTFAGKTENDSEFKNCNSLNNYICGELGAGGFAGMMVAVSGDAAADSVYVEKCLNNSFVKASTDDCHSGGICGYMETNSGSTFVQCYNLGDIEGRASAGGLVGCAIVHSGLEPFRFCYNTGSISASSTFGTVGGIAGEANSDNDNTIYFSGCLSTGYLGKAPSVGGLVGYSTHKFWCYADQPNYYYGAKSGTPTDTAFNDACVTELTSEQANGNTIICDKLGHTAAAHWTVVAHPTCTEAGELVLKCAVCGAVMEDKTIGVLGHHYDLDNDGKCVNCGLTADQVASQAGSVFTRKTIMGVAIATAVVLLVLAGAWVVIRKKKEKQPVQE